MFVNGVSSIHLEETEQLLQRSFKPFTPLRFLWIGDMQFI